MTQVNSVGNLLENQAAFAREFAQDVIDGLSAVDRFIPSKYLYDAEGSDLFEKICSLDEYYVTRVETEITEKYADELSSFIGENANLIEYGSGSSMKTRLILDSLSMPAVYMPVDISKEFLLETSDTIAMDYPALTVVPIIADFTKKIHLPEVPFSCDRRTVYFPGSTIGNFQQDKADRILEYIVNLLRESASADSAESRFLIGIDLVKEKSILEAAYDGQLGVTAEFTLNLVDRMVRELDCEIRRDDFEYVSFFNESESRIESYLEAQQDVTIKVEDELFPIANGDRIRTEYAYKYTIPSFAANVKKFGLELIEHWTDAETQFAILGFRLKD